MGDESEQAAGGGRVPDEMALRLLEVADADVVILQFVALLSLHGDQGVELALEPSDGEEEFVVVGGVHWYDSIMLRP